MIGPNKKRAVTNIQPSLIIRCSSFMKMQYWKYRNNPNSNVANIAKAISAGSFFQSLTKSVNHDFHSSFAVMFVAGLLFIILWD